MMPSAQDAGVDILGTTLAGYTGERPKTEDPTSSSSTRSPVSREVPLVVEGGSTLPRRRLPPWRHGAFAVVVGTAITHPTTITSWFASALPGALWKG